MDNSAEETFDRELAPLLSVSPEMLKTLKMVYISGFLSGENAAMKEILGQMKNKPLTIAKTAIV